MKSTSSRFIILIIVLALLMGALIYQLYQVTMVEGAEYAVDATNRRTSTIDIKGTRGRILDRNGVVLAYSKNSYNVEFLRDADNRTNYDSAVYTESLIKAIEIIEAGGGETIDTSYIRKDEEGNFYYDWGVESQAAIVARYKNFCEAMGFYIEYDDTIKDKSKWDTSEWPTAEEAYNDLRAYWFIPEELGFEEANKVISIRQEVLLNNYRAYEPITIAYDVGMEVVAEIKLRADELTGLQTSQSTIRVYPRGTTAAHVVGYLGKTVTPELKKQYGYSYEDYIGISGIEATMEQYLTGSTNVHQGKRELEVNKNGSTIRELSYTPASDGDDVMLTLDIELQAVVEQALTDLIAAINEKEVAQIEEKYAAYEEKTNGKVDGIETAKTGAAVVMDVNTGQVLAMASYPSFDPNWFIEGLSDEQAEELFQSEWAVDTTPTRNKAISTKLAPGSIFKMVTGIAGAAEGVLNINEQISCDWEYIIRYTDDDGDLVEVTSNAPKCHLTSRSKIGKHANQTLADAVKNSCNYYFCEVANRVGIDKLNEWAGKMGLTSKTGIELTGEAEGIVGGQSILFDNSLMGEDGTLDIYNQKTSLPGLIYRKLKEELMRFIEMRNMEVDDAAIESCAKRLMELQDGSITGEGAQIRRIISDELGIPEGITQERDDWINAITSLLNEIQWKPTQTIRAGFGQGTTLVTPIAVARYVSAIANEGTVYDAHIVDRVLDEDGNIVKVVKPSVFNQIDIPDEIWDSIKTGMKGVVSPEDGGTAAQAFTDEAFIEKYLETESFAGKTGTAQVGARTTNIDIENTSWFVCFAPREEPEIAIVVCVPYGLSGSSSAPAIEDILSYYFAQSENAAPENLVAINGVTE
ncbi:MAG: penicillin-binding transpeptidase domain-containing protein [Clostridia bacterium]|nr:penicillin-binding transpeptidase domain-containing protein [Clostridia bacterium]